MASGDEGRKRARPPPPSEQTVLDPKSPWQVHAAKKVRLEDKFAMDATAMKIGGVAVERLGSEGKSACEEQGEIPLPLSKERHADREPNGEDDGNGKCMHDDVRTHIDVLQPVRVGKSSNEASLVPEDPINEAEGTFVSMGKSSKQATVGPRCFTSSTDMLDFFHRLLHGWPLQLDINKYEHMMLEDLLKKGHPDWCEKVGTGIKAFQVRFNREFSNRCYYVIRTDGSTKDFSYRKCVENILPLPKLLKPHFKTSNQDEKGSKAVLNNKVSKDQGSKTPHNTKGRGNTLGKDRGGGCGISRHIQGRGNHGKYRNGNLGGIGRGLHGGQGRGKHGGLGSGTPGGVGRKF